MDFLDQYGIQLFGDSSDDDETFLVSKPRKIKATSMRKILIWKYLVIYSIIWEKVLSYNWCDEHLPLNNQQSRMVE